MEHTKLSSTVTVAKYRQLEAEKDRTKIADFILQRFTERYIRPLHGDSTRKNGFCTMAVSCLMIEALESFWNGWPDTTRKSQEAFRSFFKRCSEQNSPLGVFADPHSAPNWCPDSIFLRWGRVGGGFGDVPV